ncbi:hypothetical protein [Methylobacterium sp. yr596]|uniref:hypothetical protein n=1 Tax=Methylobacterium sp. yr596 TaxID=1761800 RepID=UPI0008E1BCDA|nr:hypothetical protein [Methylobacterium sp. yr596]SFE90795.1 hypothetical protein SAMN04487844_107151 [Methylobacterium sp. yr596]
MSHVTRDGPRARVTDHAVRRYCERFLGAALDGGLDDQKALPALRKAGHDRRRCGPGWPTSAGF